MKRLLVLMVPFIMISCYDAELIIPGETTGGPDIEIAEPYLKQYNSRYPNFEYTLEFIRLGTENETGDVFLSDYQSHNGDNIHFERFTENAKENKLGRISSIILNESTYNFYYSQKYDSIKFGNLKLTFIYDDKGKIVNAVKTESDEIVANYNFTTTDRGFITGYEYIPTPIEDNAPTINSKLNIVIRESNGGVSRKVNAINYTKDNLAITNLSFQYDEYPNPIAGVASVDFNPLVFLLAFNEGMTDRIMPQLDILALLISENNRINVEKDGEDFTLDYTYNTFRDNRPERATVKIGDVENQDWSVLYNYR
ncbi:hypothetical protein GO491_11410 [Flavobacteriaceae bacterium Ap0902]|nr:hypothetical protein [Flavobacteriaceae bacterium Ap0902]